MNFLLISGGFLVLLSLWPFIRADRPTEIKLTPAEIELAKSDGWLALTDEQKSAMIDAIYAHPSNQKDQQ